MFLNLPFQLFEPYRFCQNCVGFDPALYSLTGSFRQFLLRNKLMADGRRAGYYNLFKLTQRAARLKSQIGFRNKEKLTKDLNKLIADVNAAGAIFNQSWLEEKILELSDALG